MEYPKCTGINADLPCLQHAQEKLLIAAFVLVAAEGHDHSQEVFPESSQGVFSEISQRVSPETSQGLFPEISQGPFPETSQGAFPETSQGVFPKISQGVFRETLRGIGTLPGNIKTLSGSSGNLRKQL